jgi:hypothetical protein
LGTGAAVRTPEEVKVLREVKIVLLAVQRLLKEDFEELKELEKLEKLVSAILRELRDVDVSESEVESKVARIRQLGDPVRALGSLLGELKNLLREVERLSQLQRSPQLQRLHRQLNQLYNDLQELLRRLARRVVAVESAPRQRGSRGAQRPMGQLAPRGTAPAGRARGAGEENRCILEVKVVRSGSGEGGVGGVRVRLDGEVKETDEEGVVRWEVECGREVTVEILPPEGGGACYTFEKWEGEHEVAAREPARTVTVGKGIALRAYVRVLDASECAAGGREPAGQNPGKTAGS